MQVRLGFLLDDVRHQARDAKLARQQVNSAQTSLQVFAGIYGITKLPCEYVRQYLEGRYFLSYNMFDKHLLELLRFVNDAA